MRFALFRDVVDPTSAAAAALCVLAVLAVLALVLLVTAPRSNADRDLLLWRGRGVRRYEAMASGLMAIAKRCRGALDAISLRSPIPPAGARRRPWCCRSD